MPDATDAHAEYGKLAAKACELEDKIRQQRRSVTNLAWLENDPSFRALQDDLATIQQPKAQAYARMLQAQLAQGA